MVDSEQNCPYGMRMHGPCHVLDHPLLIKHSVSYFSSYLYRKALWILYWRSANRGPSRRPKWKKSIHIIPFVTHGRGSADPELMCGSSLVPTLHLCHDELRDITGRIGNCGSQTIHCDNKRGGA